MLELRAQQKSVGSSLLQSLGQQDIYPNDLFGNHDKEIDDSLRTAIKEIVPTFPIGSQNAIQFLYKTGADKEDMLLLIKSIGERIGEYILLVQSLDAIIAENKKRIGILKAQNTRLKKKANQ